VETGVIHELLEESRTKQKVKSQRIGTVVQVGKRLGALPQPAHEGGVQHQELRIQRREFAQHLNRGVVPARPPFHQQDLALCKSFVGENSDRRRQLAAQAQ
jgi:hypothetical protein